MRLFLLALLVLLSFLFLSFLRFCLLCHLVLEQKFVHSLFLYFEGYTATILLCDSADKRGEERQGGKQFALLFLRKGRFEMHKAT